MIVKLLTEHHLEFLNLKRGCTGSSESTLVKMSNCWKSHGMYLYQVNITLHFLNDVIYDIESTQNLIIMS